LAPEVSRTGTNRNAIGVAAKVLFGRRRKEGAMAGEGLRGHVGHAQHQPRADALVDDARDDQAGGVDDEEPRVLLSGNRGREQVAEPGLAREPP
jgi:hypothetical protein